MQQEYTNDFMLDADGKPAGGLSRAKGISIVWQNGPLGAPDDPNRREPNGAFVETLLAISRDRLQWYNDNGFECEENTEAIRHINIALKALAERTARRTRQGVEGTHEGN